MYLIVRDKVVVKTTYEREEAYRWAKVIMKKGNKVRVYEAKLSDMNLKVAREVRGIK